MTGFIRFLLFITYCDSSTKRGLTIETLGRRYCIDENTKLKRKDEEVF